MVGERLFTLCFCGIVEEVILPLASRIYAGFCALVCGFCLYANSVGWNVIDFGSPSRSKPTGGARMYHK